MAAWPAPPGRDWSLELLAERAVDEAREKPGRAQAGRSGAGRNCRRQTRLIESRAAEHCWLAARRSRGPVPTPRSTQRGAITRRRRPSSRTWVVTTGRGQRWHAMATTRTSKLGTCSALRSCCAKRSKSLGLDSDATASSVTTPTCSLSWGSLTGLTSCWWRQERRPTPGMTCAPSRRSRGPGRWWRLRAGDARATERFLREAERLAPAADWFQSHIGGAFFAEAAMMLDRVGLGDQAREYLAKCEAHCRDFTGEDPPAQVYAFLTARSGDPLAGLDALQAIVRESFIEKRYVWRHQLMAAWATFRAGRAGAGELASQALATAADLGGGDLRVAMALERELTTALAPLGRAGWIEACARAADVRTPVHAAAVRYPDGDYGRRGRGRAASGQPGGAGADVGSGGRTGCRSMWCSTVSSPKPIRPRDGIACGRC